MKLSCFLLPGILITVAACLSCNKNNNGSKPQISIAYINNPVQPDQPLDVNLKFSNGSKLSGGTFVAFRIRLNQIPPPNPVGGDTITTTIPDFSGADQGEMEYTQPYQGYLHFI